MDDFKHLYYSMLEETFQYGQMSESMTIEIITLIFKKGDSEMLTNYRPISLIIKYCLLISQAHAKSYKNIVHNDKTAYIKGRYIGSNIRIIDGILEYDEGKNSTGALIFLDFEKAFDSVNWYFMFKVNDKFNFVENLKKWIQILYTDPNILVKNNGWVSNRFTAERGIRQGCPISALLFILVVEIMGVRLRSDNDIHDCTINDEEFKLSQYADNSTLISDIESSTIHWQV